MEIIEFIIEECREGGYEAKAMGFSIFTEGTTLKEVSENITDAIACHFDEGQLYISKIYFHPRLRSSTH